MQASNITVTIMCDYCADGLWYNGSAIDMNFLMEEFQLKDTDQLTEEIDNWQSSYEKFDLWNPMVDDTEITTSKEFLFFIIQGEKIAKQIRQLLPTSVKVEYFNEDDHNRYAVEMDGELVLKDKVKVKDE
jgi:hypothetical protein